MDNSTDRNRNHAEGSTADGYGESGGIPQTAQQSGYAMPGEEIPAGFFEDAVTLEQSPFDEEFQEKAVQADTLMDADFAETEESFSVLPVAPAMAQEQMAGQLSEESEESGEENLVPEPEDFGGCEPEDYGLDGADPEETGAEEAAGEENAAGGNKERETAEDRKRAEHEAAEAKRKAEWEAGQQAKRDAEKVQLERLSSMGDEEVVAEAMRRVGADTEKLTRRNMKDCVSEYIQTLCLEDPEFAHLAMHPRKTMVHCFRYINRKAREFVEQEMKDNDIKPENGIYGSDVPDDLCYQWGEDYFRDPDAEEDKEKNEKFVPKPYTGKTGSKSSSRKSSAKKSVSKKADTKEPEDDAGKEEKKAGGQPAEKKQKETIEDGQISIAGQMTFEDFAA